MDNGGQSLLGGTPKPSLFRLKSYREIMALLERNAVHSGECFSVEGRISAEQVMGLSKVLGGDLIPEDVKINFQLEDESDDTLDSSKVALTTATDEAARDFFSDLSALPQLSFMQANSKDQDPLRMERAQGEEGLPFSELDLYPFRERSAAAAAEEEREEHDHSNSWRKNA